jgi:transposase
MPFFEEDGFTLGYKRLSQGYFKWSRNAEEARNLTWEEYDRLMDGFEIESSIKGI